MLLLVSHLVLILGISFHYEQSLKSIKQTEASKITHLSQDHKFYFLIAESRRKIRASETSELVVVNVVETIAGQQSQVRHEKGEDSQEPMFWEMLV